MKAILAPLTVGEKTNKKTKYFVTEIRGTGEVLSIEQAIDIPESLVELVGSLPWPTLEYDSTEKRLSMSRDSLIDLLKSKVANHRWFKLNSQVYFKDLDLMLRTDDVTVAKIDSLFNDYVNGILEEGEKVTFVQNGVGYDLVKSDLLWIKKSLRGLTQQSFEREIAINSNLENVANLEGDYDAILAAINLELEDWPSTEFVKPAAKK